jgi:hypothetical protein
MEAAAFERVGNPDLDDRLAGDPQPSGFGVERLDHPYREINVHALDLLVQATR